MQRSAPESVPGFKLLHAPPQCLLLQLTIPLPAPGAVSFSGFATSFTFTPFILMPAPVSIVVVGQAPFILPPVSGFMSFWSVPFKFTPPEGASASGLLLEHLVQLIDAALKSSLLQVAAITFLAPRAAALVVAMVCGVTSFSFALLAQVCSVLFSSTLFIFTSYRLLLLLNAGRARLHCRVAVHCRSNGLLCVRPFDWLCVRLCVWLCVWLCALLCVWLCVWLCV